MATLAARREQLKAADRTSAGRIAQAPAALPAAPEASRIGTTDRALRAAELALAENVILQILDDAVLHRPDLLLGITMPKQRLWHDSLCQQGRELVHVLLNGLAGIECGPQILWQEVTRIWKPYGRVKRVPMVRSS